MSLAIIAAVAKNNCIGIKNTLPWDIPEDLKHFQEMTNGKCVLMGQNTFDSILSRLGGPLPGRKNIVVTLDPNYQAPPGVEVFFDLDKALEKYKDQELFIAGGASVYKQTIDRADFLYITHIDKDYEGDAYFPEVDWAKWQKIAEEKRQGFSFAVYQRNLL